MEPWDPEEFLKKLAAGEFDNRVNDELGRLSQDQLQAILQVLDERKRKENDG
jgi:uncharacterized protein (DUF433 family)